VPQPDAVAAVTRDAAVSALVLPLRIERAGSHRTLVIGMADPTDLQAVDKLQFKVGMSVRPLLATSSQLRRGIARAYGVELAASGPERAASPAGQAAGGPAAPPATRAATGPAPFGPWSERTPPMSSRPAAPPTAAPPPPAWTSRTPPMGNLASAAMSPDATPIPRTPATAGHPDVIVELRVMGGPRDGLRVALPQARTLVVGRGTQVEVIDLGSSNGTYVNGHPVSTVALKDGDRVQLGRTVIVISMQRR